MSRLQAVSAPCMKSGLVRQCTRAMEQHGQGGPGRPAACPSWASTRPLGPRKARLSRGLRAATSHLDDLSYRAGEGQHQFHGNQ